MAGELRFDFRFRKTRPQRPAGRDAAQILVLGDFSGNGDPDRELPPLSQRRLRALDIDSFETVMKQVNPRVHLDGLGAGETGLEIAADEMEQLHPDSLFQHLDLFRGLREMRERLLDPSRFAAALAELQSRGLEPKAAPTDAGGTPAGSAGASSPEPERRENDASTLERLLGADSSAEPRPEPAAGVDASAFIRNLVAPHIVPDADPRQEIYVESVDAAIRAQMRAILHHPSFQTLEASWRGLSWLVSELELGEDLELVLCDVSKAELLADLRGSAETLDESECYRLLIEGELDTPGGRAWSLILGDYYFDHGEDDSFLLAALGALAQRAGAPLLSGAREALLGCPSLAEFPDPASWNLEDAAAQERWTALRRSSQASHLGLALPRVLARQPYGERSEAIDSFPFEELGAVPEHGSFLWANPIYALALMLAPSLTEGGAQASPLELSGCPVYAYTVDGEQVMKPCAEYLLGERAVEAILGRGIMPLSSHRNADRVRCARIQSLADPPQGIQGF